MSQQPAVACAGTACGHELRTLRASIPSCRASNVPKLVYSHWSTQFACLLMDV